MTTLTTDPLASVLNGLFAEAEASMPAMRQRMAATPPESCCTSWHVPTRHGRSWNSAPRSECRRCIWQPHSETMAAAG
jgi:hypothetical protein